jgi:glycosyltransferase involved in cell wall biosynthesis
MPAPAVTIIIPTFNWSGVLPFSIGSALAQTFKDFEVLVVGDACTDDSAAVVTAVSDDRVRWINLPAHVGQQAGPNNQGLREARGRFVAYLGHDDLWLPHHLECLMPSVEGAADLAFGITVMMSPDGRTMYPVPSPAKYSSGLWVPPTSVVHKKHVVEQVGGWRHPRDLPIDTETDLWRRVHNAGCVIEAVPRLTAIKFPAVWRKNVYLERPHHEQAFWFGRLTAEHDLEPALLGRMLSDSTNGTASVRALLRSLVDVAVDRFRSEFLSRAPGLYRLAKNEQRRRHRAFKGLRPVPDRSPR